VELMAYDERDLYTGLATLAWSAHDDPGWDHDFYKRIIERNRGGALDVACGTGRLLRAYVRAGLDVEGCDISGQMLAVCREKAAQQGFRPALYEQAMQQLAIPQQYATIIIPCSSFMCVMDRQEAIEALRRFHAHLKPGGTLAFNTYLARYDYSGKAAAEAFPTPWQPHDEIEFGATKKRLVVQRRMMSVDPVEQIVTEERRYELYQDGRLIQEETHVGQCRWSFKYEVLLMLEKMGFGKLAVKGDYTDQDFGMQHTGTMVFVAEECGLTRSCSQPPSARKIVARIYLFDVIRCYAPSVAAETQAVRHAIVRRRAFQRGSK
jgi:ubiquinone/menaquinone biosynthesis C-methylase UbiE